MGSIYVISDKALVSDIQAIVEQLPDYFKQNVIEGAKEDYGFYLSIYTPVDEGILVGSNIFIDDGPYDFYSDNEKDYYPFVVLGTRPHWIGSPVNIKGSWVYIGEHPGTAPQDFPLLAFEEGDQSIDSRLEEMATWIVTA